MLNFFKKSKRLKVGAKVKYENEIFTVEMMDKNGDNLYLYNGIDGHSSVSKNDVEILEVK